MIAWDPKTTDEASPEKLVMLDPAGLMYRVALAFPSWACALLPVYAIFLARVAPKVDAFRIRPRSMED